MRSDEELVLAIRRGDQAAFDELYGRYSGKVFGYIHRLLGDRAAAEDVFQEVFMEVLKKDALELRTKQFGGWLFTVARNRCLTHARTAQRRREMLSGAASSLAPSSPPVQHAERIDAVAEVLDTLSEAHREV